MSGLTATTRAFVSEHGRFASDVLIDTTIVSELRKGPRCHPRVAAWSAAFAHEDVALSVLAIGEIRCGVERIRRRDARRAASLEQWLVRLLGDHAERVLPVDQHVAEEWGRLTAARSGPLVDLLMAATARVHGLTLVTRNIRDVEATGVGCLNPFDVPA